jgi:hypothetical protein
VDRKELRKAEMDGLKAVIESARASGTPRLDLEAKLLNLETLDLTRQALETPLSPEALAITSGPGPGGKTS